jgi:hypothetical protein
VLVLGCSGEEKEGVGCWAVQRKRQRRWRAGPAREYVSKGFWKILKTCLIPILIQILNEFYMNLKLKHSIKSK